MREIIPMILGNFWVTSSDTLKNFDISGTYSLFMCQDEDEDENEDEHELVRYGY